MSVTDQSTAGARGAAGPGAPRPRCRARARRPRAVRAGVREGVRAPPVGQGRGLTAEELFGQVMGLFELADRRGDAPVAVRALNPTLAGDGYDVARHRRRDEHRGLAVPRRLRDRTSSTSRGLACAAVIAPGDRHGARRRRPARRGSARARRRRARERHALRDRPPAAGRPSSPTLADGVRAVLGDVRRAVADHAEMKARLERMMEAAARRRARATSADEVDETVAFLRWLGQRQLRLPRLPRVRDRRRATRGRRWPSSPGSGLGILRRRARSTYSAPKPLDEHDAARCASASRAATCCASRRPTGSRRCTGAPHGLHRGQARGARRRRRRRAARMLGLLHVARRTWSPPPRIPLLHRKLEQIVDGGGPLRRARTTTRWRSSCSSRSPRRSCSRRRWEELRRLVVGLLQLQDARRHPRPGPRVDLDGADASRSSWRCRATASTRGCASASRTCSRSASTATRSTTTCRSASRTTRGSTSRCTCRGGQIPEVAAAGAGAGGRGGSRARGTTSSRERLRGAHGEERGRALARRGARAASPSTTSPAAISALVVDDVEARRDRADGEAFVVGLQQRARRGRAR